MYKNRQSLSDLCSVEILSKEDVLASCSPRIANKANLPSYLELPDVPHVSFMDLVVLFHVQSTYYHGTQLVTESYVLTNDDLTSFDLSVQELKIKAYRNMYKNDIKIMDVVEKQMDNPMLPMLEISQNVVTGVNVVYNKNDIKIPIERNSNEKELFFVTNRKGSFGASVILLKEFMDEIANTLNEEPFYVVPLNIHTVFCAKRSTMLKRYDTEKKAEQALEDMLEFFNETKNDEEDILSYYLYMYDPSEYQFMRL